MIEMIYRANHGDWIIQTETKTKTASKLYNLWEELLTPELSTLEGRLESTAICLGRYRHIPLWINASLCLTVYPNYQAIDRLYVNVTKIKSIQALETETLLTFESGHTHIIKGPPERIAKRFNQTKQDMKKITSLVNASTLKGPW